MKPVRALGLLLLAGFSLGFEPARPPIPDVPKVDLDRYMGDWYVIANIPTKYERNAHNARENFRLNADGTIATTFTFHEDGFDGPLRTMKPKAWVRDTETNAVWWMQFFWPLKAEYVIAYLTPDYTRAIVARTKRDYVWILARTPAIPDDDYVGMIAKIAGLGYDVQKLQRVPQRW